MRIVTAHGSSIYPDMTPQKIELLSPAQNITCGVAAIRAGADAVYIGASRFGARSKAGNSIEDIRTLCDFAHLFNARVYATLNTILYDSELQEAERIAYELYHAGVDAFIIQDMAWLKLNIPPVPLHASTQTDSRTAEKVDFLYRAGCDRVVLARELSLETIKTIHQHVPEVELEAFVHGALCVCYSGQCYLSQRLCGRSANRGECAQACRLPYRIETTLGETICERAYPLSLHDLNLAEHIETIIDAGVCSLKIEGRMKGADYVENITAFYHQRLNALLAKRHDLQRTSHGQVDIPFSPNPTATFARPFTTYFATARPKQLANLNTPKSVGESIGKVTAVGRDFIEVENSDKLANGDGIIITSQGKATGCRVNRVTANRIYTFRLASKPKIGDFVFRNANTLFEKELTLHPCSRTLEIQAQLNVHNGRAELAARDAEGIRISLPINTQFVLANKQEKQAALWQQQFAKSTHPNVRIASLSLPKRNVPFLTLSMINTLRRELIDRYVSARINAYYRPVPHAVRTYAPYPTSLHADGRLNISNRLAKEFYADHGICQAPSALDLEKEIPSSVELMRTKYCLRYELSLCPKQHTGIKASPLILTHKNYMLRVEFDCQQCEMIVKKG